MKNPDERLLDAMIERLRQVNLNSDRSQLLNSIVEDLQKAEPITVTLSAVEVLTVITIMKLASILREDLNFSREWNNFNENHILRDLHDAKPVDITLKANEAFGLVTAIQMVTVLDPHLGIMEVLAKEAGRKIHNKLDPQSSFSKHLEKGWIDE
jgi:hypothetical protein